MKGIDNNHIEIKFTENNKENSNDKILNRKSENEISSYNHNVPPGQAVPVFKSRLKALFNEFAKEEGNENFNKPSLPAINFSEKILELPDGCSRLLIFLIIMIICLILIIIFAILKSPYVFIIPVPALGLIVSIILTCNFITICPGEALVLTYYGTYIGTCKQSGYFWVRPCTDKSRVSLKSNHYNGSMIKVNDKDGTPVLIGLVCVWRIRDTVKATYCVKDSYQFIAGQTESAIRYIANKFSYDSPEENEPTLKSGNEDINTLLKLELQRRTKLAGIEIEDARITEISYGNEIASMMLQKQAADAIISSRQKIAKGAIQIIDDSIKELEKRNICKFKDDEKSKLVSNMMIVLNMDKGGKTIIKV